MRDGLVLRDWLTAAEFASLALPGMPTTKSALIRRAKAESWHSQDRKGAGGGRQYHISNLPRAAYAKFMAERFKATAGDAVEVANRAVEDATVGVEADTTPEVLRRDARLHILSLCDEFRRQLRLPKVRAQRLFADLYSSLEVTDAGADFSVGTRKYRLTVPAWVREKRPTVSAASLQRWSDALARGEIGALAGRHGNRKGSSVLDRHPALHDFVVGLIVTQPLWSTTLVRKAIVGRFGEEVEVTDGDGVVSRLPIPTERSVQRWIAAWKADNKEEYVRRTDPDAWKNGYMPAFGDASAGIERLNQLWEIDASPTDVMLADGRRYTVYVATDVFSRRIMTLISRTAKTEATLMLIRRAIMEWGVPEAIKTDNGSDFISRRFKAAMLHLEIAHDTCPPFQPWRKPFVERAIGTINRDFMPVQAGFVGHSVADRKKIEARKDFAKRLGADTGKLFEISLTESVLQERLRAWAVNDYAHEPHEGLKGKTPFDVASAWRGGIRRIDDEQALAMLVAPVASSSGRPPGIRTVMKSGIRVEDATFIAAELRDWMRQEVFVRLDPEDMGRIWVYSPDATEFICVAENAERLGIMRSVVSLETAERTRAQREADRERMRRENASVKFHRVADELAQEAAQRNATIVAFPQRSESYETPALQAAADALASQVEGPTGHSAEIEAAHAALMAEFENDRVKALREETGVDRYRRWLEIDAAKTANEKPVRDEALLWWISYQDTPEFKNLARMHKEFGDIAIGGPISAADGAKAGA